MTHAYGVFANRGVKAEPRSILRIEDIDGSIIERNRIKAQTYQNVLGLHGESLINFPNRDVAAKSGWIMGYAPNLAVGAWAGNNDNRSMRGLSGLITSPMWRDFMDVALADLEAENFTQPSSDGVKPIIRGQYIDTTSSTKHYYTFCFSQ